MTAIYELVIAGSGTNDNYFANVLHYRVVEDDPTKPFLTATGLLDQWITSMEALHQPILANDVAVRNFSCRRISPTGGNTASRQHAYVGTGGASSMANGVGADIAMIADASLLKSVGHMYTPSVAFEMLAGGQWQAGFEADVNAFTAGLALTMHFDACTADLTIYHKKTHTDDLVSDYVLRPKPVLLNKRLRPVV